MLLELVGVHIDFMKVRDLAILVSLRPVNVLSLLSLHVLIFILGHAVNLGVNDGAGPLRF